MCIYDTAFVIGEEIIKLKIEPKDESKNTYEETFQEKIIQQFMFQTLVIY